MPTQTFFNLPKEKQNSIHLAAMNEFSKVEFSKASINQIIKDAGIPRGSFYMYFEDKYDLFNFCIQAMMDELRTALFRELMKSGGDLESLIYGLHDYLFDTYEQNKQYEGFVKHVMIYFQSQFETLDHTKKNHQPLREGMRRIVPHLNDDQFEDCSDESKYIAVEIAFSVLRSVMVNSFMQNKSHQVSKLELKKYMSIVQSGYIKKVGKTC
ncbi:MAG: TetR/AcrR family transcriptional regulator [Candidatus Izemoplasmatales bacterium]